MWMFAAQAAMSALSAASQYKADKAQAKAQQAFQKYRNTMTRLSDGVNQNAITTNELLMREASAEQGVQIAQQGLFDTARVEVSAAAAGVKGRSVNQTMLDTNRDIAVRERQRQVSLDNAMLAVDQQRLNSSMSAEMQQDYSYIPKPKAATYFLKFAADTATSAWNNKMFGLNQ